MLQHTRDPMMSLWLISVFNTEALEINTGFFTENSSPWSVLYSKCILHYGPLRVTNLTY